MKRVFEILLDKILVPLFVGALGHILVAVGSHLQTGNWKRWFEQVPILVWLLIAFLFVSWVAIILVRKQLGRIRERESKGIYTPSVGSVWGYREIGKIRHAEVIWKILAPNPSLVQSAISYEEALTSIEPESIKIDIPPRCPRCNTKLEEKHRILRGYRWSCVSCDFSKNNKDGFYKEADRAKKRAESKLEKGVRFEN